tara:strand:+ start:198 stop:377 length:180 start_codon:yes stop_codon:yes gene_type:complete
MLCVKIVYSLHSQNLISILRTLAELGEQSFALFLCPEGALTALGAKTCGFGDFVKVTAS